MKKIMVWIGGVLVLGGMVSGVLWRAGIWPQGQGADPIIIAVVGPTRGPDVGSGEAMRKGIQLYLQTHDIKKKLHGRPIDLRFFNDQGTTQQAAKVADEVVNANALLVLGHYFSDSSRAAGDTYQKRGIPAITASATAETITAGNDWYFQTISNNAFQGRFIASYVKNILNHDTTIIIYDADLYGSSLKQNYEEIASELGLEIQKRKNKAVFMLPKQSGNALQDDKIPQAIAEKLSPLENKEYANEEDFLNALQKQIGPEDTVTYKSVLLKHARKLDETWRFDRETENLRQQIESIVTDLQKVDDPGMIFLAMHDTEAVEIIKALKRPGMPYTFIGADALAAPQFLEDLQQTPQERSEPGYYSDGIYVATPFIEDLATDAGLEFIRQFEQKYGHSPSWESAFYYDAAMIAVTAIERAELDGLDLTTDRRKVRDALKELSNPDRAMIGATGTLYFDAKRNINRPLNVGIYERQRLLPAYVQYQAIETQPSGSRVSSALFKQRNILELGGLAMAPTQIIKAGLNVNEISYLNLLSGQYTLDGYLWFRFQGELETNALKFRNAVAPVSLDKPVLQGTEGSITTQIYHLKGSFTPRMMITHYPWDRLILPVQFRHLARPVTSIRYVVDTANITENPEQDASLIDPVTGWDVEDVQSVVTTIKENSVSYSQFNMIVQLNRITIGWMIKNLFPLNVLMLMLYWVYYLPIERPMSRLLLIGGTLTATILYEVLLRQLFRPTGVLMIEYGIFAMYGLIGLAIIVSLSGYICYTRKMNRAVKLLSFTGRILHPILAALVVMAGGVFTMISPRHVADFISQLL